jgi:hypothetical protein
MENELGVKEENVVPVRKQENSAIHLIHAYEKWRVLHIALRFGKLLTSL